MGWSAIVDWGVRLYRIDADGAALAHFGEMGSHLMLRKGESPSISIPRGSLSIDVTSERVFKV
jgi:hypothetical protein